MEALVALGLACNVLQVVGDGIKVAKTLKQVYQDGSTEDQQRLAVAAQNLSSATSKLQQLQNQSNTQNYDDLKTIAKHCVDVAHELQQKVAPFCQLGTRRRDKFKKSIDALRGKGELEKLEKRLESYQKALNTQMIASLASKVDRTSIEQKDWFTNLESSIKDQIYQDAQTQKVEHNNTRQVIRDQSQYITSKMEAIQFSNDEKAQYEKLLTSLRFPNMNARKNQITPADTKTFEWIFGKHVEESSEDDDDDDDNDDDEDTDEDDDDEGDGGDDGSVDGHELLWDDFGEWLRTDQATYWISGKPGAGKSTLMNFIRGHETTRTLLEEWASPQQLMILEAYLWNAGSPDQKSIFGLFATLIVHIFHTLPHSAALILKHFPDVCHKWNTKDWSQKELQDCLILLLRASDVKFCIFIDGLDEAIDKEHHAVIQSIELLSSLDSVKCCVSSRPIQVFVNAFRDKPKLRLQDLTAKDIDAVFQQNIKPAIHDSEISMSEDDFERLKNNFRHKAGGVFLWVHLAVRSLKKGLSNLDSYNELESRLDLLPPELNQLYEHMWTKNNADSELYREEAAWFFRLALISESKAVFFYISVLDCTLCLPRNQVILEAGVAGTAHPELYRECEVTNVHILARCAGLLEIREVAEDSMPKFNLRFSEDSKLERWRLTRVDFIHRTAYDFLTNTSFGQQITSITKLKYMDSILSLVRAKFCQAYISASASRMRLVRDLLGSFRCLEDAPGGSDSLEMLLLIESMSAKESLRLYPAQKHQVWFTRMEDTEASDGDLSRDFLGETVWHNYTSLANVRLQQNGKKINPRYCQYLLCCFNLSNCFYSPNPLNYLRLLRSIIQQLPERSNKDFGRRAAETFYLGYNDGTVASRMCFHSHIYRELWSSIRIWTSGRFDLRIRSMIPEICKTLVSKTDLNEKLLLFANIDAFSVALDSIYKSRSASFSIRLYSSLPCRIFENPDRDNGLSRYRTLIVMECNTVLILRSIVLSWCEKYGEELFAEFLSALQKLGFKEHLKVLLVSVDKGGRDRPWTLIKDQDSKALISCLHRSFDSDRSEFDWIEAGAHDFDYAAFKELKSMINDIHSRSQLVDARKYMKENGWYTGHDDPAIMRYPPPMYLDDVEDEMSEEPPEINPGQSSPACSNAEGPDDNFFDATEEL